MPLDRPSADEPARKRPIGVACLGVALAAIAVLPPGVARADPPPRMPIPRSMIGVWAGERMACTAPIVQLHVFRRQATRHPRVFDDEEGHACVVVNVRGSAPAYRVRLRCRAFGPQASRRERPALQTAVLAEGGMRMHITMWDTSDGGPLREDHLYRCPGRDPMSRRPRGGG